MVRVRVRIRVRVKVRVMVRVGVYWNLRFAFALNRACFPAVLTAAAIFGKASRDSW